MERKRVVLITGVAMGDGLRHAKAFTAKGADVAVCGRSTEGLESISLKYPNALAILAALSTTGQSE